MWTGYALTRCPYFEAQDQPILAKTCFARFAYTEPFRVRVITLTDSGERGLCVYNESSQTLTHTPLGLIDAEPINKNIYFCTQSQRLNRKLWYLHARLEDLTRELEDNLHKTYDSYFRLSIPAPPPPPPPPLLHLTVTRTTMHLTVTMMKTMMHPTKTMMTCRGGSGGMMHTTKTMMTSRGGRGGMMHPYDEASHRFQMYPSGTMM